MQRQLDGNVSPWACRNAVSVCVYLCVQIGTLWGPCFAQNKCVNRKLYEINVPEHMYIYTYVYLCMYLMYVT